MAGLLRDSEHEDDDATMGRMASPPLPLLYLEAMEDAENKGKESNATGHTGMASEVGEQLPKVLLAHGEERPCTEGNLKRKTRTGRILQYP